MKRRIPLLALIPFLFLVLAGACEEGDDSGPVTIVEDEPGLLAQATIPVHSAVALAKVQGGMSRRPRSSMRTGA